MTRVTLDADRIEKVLQDHRRTQSGIAEAAGVSTRTVNSAMGGRPISERTARAIADALGVPLETIRAPGEAVPPDASKLIRRPDLEAKLRHGNRASVSCFAYLAGDWSIFATHRAFILPIDARVHVSVVDHTSTLSVEVFAWCAPDTWLLDEPASEFVCRLLKKILADSDTHKLYPKLPRTARIVIASEIPRNVSLYEEGALAMALAKAMTSSKGSRQRESDTYPARVAQSLLHGWYPDVSPVALLELASVDDPVERSNQVVAVYDPGLKSERAGNVAAGEPRWGKPQWRDLPQLSVWWDGTAAAPVPRESSVRDRLVSLRGPLTFVLKQMNESMKLDGEAREQQLGYLMQMHHQMLAYGGFVDRDAHELVTRVNGLTDYVRGAKLAGSRGRGAIVVLAKRGIRSSDLMRVLKALGLRPLDEFRSKLQV